eukprot:4180254-Karenia_brevis.AAC.1
MQYLWTALVTPVMLYGSELLANQADQETKVRAFEIEAWRSMLRLGGRSPADATCPSIGLLPEISQLSMSILATHCNIIAPLLENAMVPADNERS